MHCVCTRDLRAYMCVSACVHERLYECLCAGTRVYMCAEGSVPVWVCVGLCLSEQVGCPVYTYVCVSVHRCPNVCARVTVCGAAVGCLHLSAVNFTCMLFRFSSVSPSPVDHLLGSKSLVKIVGVCPIINICNMAFTQTAKTIFNTVCCFNIFIAKIYCNPVK